MQPCPGCRRHVRDHEVQCPFCAADLPSSRVSAVFGAVAISALVLLGVSGCSSDSVPSDDANTTTSNGTADTTDDEPTTDPTVADTSDSAMTDAETDTDDGPDETTLTSGSFYAGPEIDFGVPECDPIQQDCPDGEKCVPHASNGGTWDAVKCVPILGDGEPGDSCTYNGLIEATDDCDGSSMCWNAVEVDGEWVGTCTAFCTPPHADPQCAEGTTCLITNDGSINLCVQSCDPVEQNCPEGQGCYWIAEEFICLPDYSDPMGQPCDFIAQCPAGSECVAAALLPECEGTACCAAYCSLGDPMCGQPGTECVPLFDGEPPPGYEDVGLCIVPE